MSARILVNHLSIVLALVSLAACNGRSSGVGGPADADGGVTTDTAVATRAGLAVLGHGAHTPESVRLDEIGVRAHGLRAPRDVAFNPEHPDQMWVVNNTDHSVVIYFEAGTENQSQVKRTGRSAEHFLARPSALAFGVPGFFASAQDEDRVTQSSTPADFMGPTLWTSDVEVFDATNDSHYDMLHNSPNSAGIAWEADNIYWIFDGAHNALARYDFNMHHGPAGEDHTDGEVRRFVEGEVSYVRGVSSHMEMDRETKKLYVADTGNNRIAVLDTTTGTRGTRISPNYDGSVQYRMNDAAITTLVDGAAAGLRKPSGLAIYNGNIYVTDNESSKIFAFSMDGTLRDWVDLSTMIPTGGLMGLDFDANGHIFVADTAGNRIFRVRPL